MALFFVAAMLLNLAQCADRTPAPKNTASGSSAKAGSNATARPASRARPAAMDTREVGPNLKKIFEGARSYYEKGAMVTRSGAITPNLFPASVDLTPGTDCAAQAGGQCRSTRWNDPSWLALDFEIKGAHRFSYSFTSSGEGQKARFVARAVARLPGARQWLVFERSGEVTPQLRVEGPKELRSRKVASLAALRLAVADRRLADCQKNGFLPQRNNNGQLLGRRPKPQPNKGKAYCVQLWKARCSVNAFLSRHPRGCKNATHPPKPDDDGID